jgi:DNA-binding MarR family transcriptional regulator
MTSMRPRPIHRADFGPSTYLQLCRGIRRARRSQKPRVLWETDGPTPGDLADRLHVATPTVVKSANRMEASGLLTRRRDSADARMVRLYLTERARSVRVAIETDRDELARAATASLTQG